MVLPQMTDKVLAKRFWAKYTKSCPPIFPSCEPKTHSRVGRHEEHHSAIFIGGNQTASTSQTGAELLRTTKT